MTADRRSRWVWRSTDGGGTWEPCEVLKGSIVYAAVKSGEDYDDGYGNLYRDWDQP